MRIFSWFQVVLLLLNLDSNLNGTFKSTLFIVTPLASLRISVSLRLHDVVGNAAERLADCSVQGVLKRQGGALRFLAACGAAEAKLG